MKPESKRPPATGASGGECGSPVEPPVINTITVHAPERRAGFDGALIVTVISVVLTNFGRALLGPIAAATWDYLKRKFRQLRSKGNVEIVYSDMASRIEVTIRYPSVAELRKDLRMHPSYLRLAQNYAKNGTPRPGETLSLTTSMLAAGSSQDRMALTVRILT